MVALKDALVAMAEMARDRIKKQFAHHFEQWGQQEAFEKWVTMHQEAPAEGAEQVKYSEAFFASDSGSEETLVSLEKECDKMVNWGQFFWFALPQTFDSAFLEKFSVGDAELTSLPWVTMGVTEDGEMCYMDIGEFQHFIPSICFYISCVRHFQVIDTAFDMPELWEKRLASIEESTRAVKAAQAKFDSWKNLHEECRAMNVPGIYGQFEEAAQAARKHVLDLVANSFVSRSAECKTASMVEPVASVIAQVGKEDIYKSRAALLYGICCSEQGRLFSEKYAYAKVLDVAARRMKTHESFELVPKEAQTEFLDVVKKGDQAFGEVTGIAAMFSIMISAWRQYGEHEDRAVVLREAVRACKSIEIPEQFNVVLQNCLNGLHPYLKLKKNQKG